MNLRVAVFLAVSAIALPAHAAHHRHHHHHHHAYTHPHSVHHAHASVRHHRWHSRHAAAAGVAYEAASGRLPHTGARSYVLMDYQTGQVLAERNPNEHLPMASLTKIMTAYLVFDAIKAHKLGFDQPVTISPYAASMPRTRMGLKAGNKVPVRMLLTGLIVDSGNDAAVALAEAVGGNLQNFANMMNSKAQALGMANTHYWNPNGLPASAKLPGGNYTTAHDLSVLARAVIRDYPDDYAMFSTRTYAYGGRIHVNHNHLLGAFEGVDGIKTGFTNAARWCLVASARRNNQRLISVVLGENNRFVRDSDSKHMLAYGFHALTTRQPVSVAATPATAQAKGRHIS